MSEKTWWGADETEDVPQDVATVRPKNNKLSIIGSLAMIAVLTASLVGATFYKPNPYAAHPGAFGSIEHPATVEGVINECGPIFEYTPRSTHYGEIPVGYTKPANGMVKQIPVQPMVVPAYGYMANGETKLGDKVDHFFSIERKDVPTNEQVLRLMWEGWTVIWYLPPIADRTHLTAHDLETTFNPATVEAIKIYAEKHDKVIALPWKESKPLPLNRNMGLSRWASTQSCGVWNSSIVDEFINSDKNLGKKRSIEPPVAKLDEEGKLFEIDVLSGQRKVN